MTGIIRKKVYMEASIKSLLTVKMLNAKNPCFPVGGIRHNIFHAETNGLAASGALIRFGRKILIDEEKFIDWVTSRNGRA